MSSTTNTTTQPNFSPGSDPSTLAATLAPLLIANGGRWTLTADGLALERSVKFKTFAKTWDFMTAVSLQCKLKNHHPEWSNVYNTTFIRWTTHHPKGLSAKDIELASICDSLAKDFGEVIEEAPPAQQQQQQQQQQAEGTTTPSGDNDGAACPMFMPGLANRAVGSAEDCCIPKSSKK